MRATLYTVEGLPVGKISIMARPRGGDWLFDEARAMREAGVDVVVSCLTSKEERDLDLEDEAECCAQQEIAYFSFPIRDFSVPAFSVTTFSMLEQLHAYLCAGKHVALHCRQGFGRSPMVAASLLVLSDFSPDQAFELLSRARMYAVPETEEQREWVVRFYHHTHSLTEG